jgi:GntR family transcriptional regulator, transcriptional repressor for pyruvate dehydrogenase complex
MAIESQSQKKVALAVSHIEDLILEFSARKKWRLPSERALSELLLVSRSTVREALRALAGQNRIYVKHGSGIYIAHSMSRRAGDSLDYLYPGSGPVSAELMEARIAYECHAVKLAARNSTAEDLRRLESVLRDMHAAAVQNDLTRSVRLNAEFHLQISKAAHNHFLHKFYLSIKALFDAHMEAVYGSMQETEARLLVLHAQHERIFRAIAARNEAHAHAAMESHIDYGAALCDA